MRVGVFHVLIVAAGCLLGLSGCESWNKTGEWLSKAPEARGTSASAAAPVATPAALETTGSIQTAITEVIPDTDGSTTGDPIDELNLGKRHFRENNFGLAERHFRRAVEKAPIEQAVAAEAWLGLAASYDRLRRFELADRAYAQVIKIVGPTPEILNNQGYSYMLRGNYARARVKLAAAYAKDPKNPHIQANLDLLEQSVRRKR